jgi:hypothetical protein
MTTMVNLITTALQIITADLLKTATVEDLVCMASYFGIGDQTYVLMYNVDYPDNRIIAYCYNVDRGKAVIPSRRTIAHIAIPDHML